MEARLDSLEGLTDYRRCVSGRAGESPSMSTLGKNRVTSDRAEARRLGFTLLDGGDSGVRVGSCVPHGRWSARAVSRLIDTRSRVPKAVQAARRPLRAVCIQTVIHVCEGRGE